ncbi:unnamed protein product [Arabis nemorensis]|uniref:Uncharacterized protein n=1 Tax=Arabis nemorensis TaxID=586526 RepID=A0A565CL47_9BRAS|nr:unnamed protein product [Arabis nemorensis]
MAEPGTGAQDIHPVTGWFVGLRNLGNEVLRLFHPVACTALSYFGASVITVSPKFRRQDQLLQLSLTFGLIAYVALTAVITFGTWTTRRVVNAAIPPHFLLNCVLKVISISLVLWLWSVTLLDGDYRMGLGIGRLVVQAQYLGRLQGYNIRLNTLIIGLICLAGLIVVHECHSILGSIISLIGFGAAILAFK